MKSRKMGIPPLCGEYPFWVPYTSLKVEEGRHGIRYCIRNGIKDYSLLEILLLGSHMFVALEIKVENMKIFCT